MGGNFAGWNLSKRHAYPPQGHILTAYSHVLDTDYITVYLADGRKFEAKLLGADPRLDAAALKIDAEDLPYFDLDRAAKAEEGANVLAPSNLSTWPGDERQTCNTALFQRSPIWRPCGAYETLIADRYTCLTRRQTIRARGRGFSQPQG